MNRPTLDIFGLSLQRLLYTTVILSNSFIQLKINITLFLQNRVAIHLNALVGLWLLRVASFPLRNWAHVFVLTRRLNLALHIPVPLVDLTLLQTDLVRQSGYLLLGPHRLSLEFFQKQLILVIVLTKSFLNLAVLFHRVVRWRLWVCKCLKVTPFPSITD